MSDELQCKWKYRNEDDTWVTSCGYDMRDCCSYKTFVHCPWCGRTIDEVEGGDIET